MTAVHQEQWPRGGEAASPALSLGDLDITTTDVSLKGACNVPGVARPWWSSQRRPQWRSQARRAQAWRASWSFMPITKFYVRCWTWAATPRSTGGSTRSGCGRQSWSPSRTTWRSRRTWCCCTSRCARLAFSGAPSGRCPPAAPPRAEGPSSSQLRAQISSCDTILGTMEEMLGKFQSDLGNISTEIRALQEQSQSMSVRLRNRKAAELQLGAFLDSLALPAPLIDGILQPKSDAAFQARAPARRAAGARAGGVMGRRSDAARGARAQEHLEALQGKLEFAARSETAQESAAFRDVAPELERLRAKAVAKARELLMARRAARRRGAGRRVCLGRLPASADCPPAPTPRVCPGAGSSRSASRRPTSKSCSRTCC